MDMIHAVAALTVLNALLILWVMRMIVFEIQTGLSQLDSQLADAIKGLIDGGMLSDFEPPNPIQQAIANMLSRNLETTVEVIPRNEDGTFRP